MSEKKARFVSFQTIAPGLSLSLFFLWIPLCFPLLFPTMTEAITTRGPRELALSFVVLSGFALALLLDRFWPKSWKNSLRLAAVALLLLLCLFFTYGLWPSTLAVGAAFLASFFLSVSVLPVIQTLTTLSAALNAFATAAAVLLLAAFPVFTLSRALIDNGLSLILIALACLFLSAPTLLSARLPNPHSEPRDAAEESDILGSDTITGRRFLLPAIFGSAFSVLVCLACLMALFDRTDPTSTWPFGVGLGFGALVVILLLTAGLRRVRLWIYLATSGMGLGIVTLLMPLSGLWITLLPLFFLVLSAVSFALLLVRLCFQQVSPINRMFSLSLCLGFLFSVIVFLSAFDPPIWTAYLGMDHPVLLCGQIFVLLFAPMLFLLEKPRVKPSAAAVSEESALSLMSALTTAEKRVYDLVIRGYANQQVADMLFISINTVKFHIKNILGKAGVSKKSQLVVLTRPDAEPEPSQRGPIAGSGAAKP